MVKNMTAKWILLSVLGALLLLTLCSCFSRLFDIASLTDSIIRYENAGKYTKGGGSVAADMEQLEINWIAGEVELVVYDGNEVTFSESSEQEIKDAFEMRYYRDTDTLYLQYAKSGKWKFGKLSKKLTVQIPRDLLLSQIRINTVSAEIKLSETAARTMKIETVSGGVSLPNGQKIDTVSLETVSGKIDFAAESIADLELNTVSGVVTIQTKITKRAKLDSVSGNLTLYLPPDSSFSARVDTVSGSFSSSFETVSDGHRRVCAGGEVPFDIDTVSGNISIQPQQD